MKLRRLISLLFVFVLTLVFVPAALASRTPSEWAVSEMEQANMYGVLTPNIMKDYHRMLTRDEFCELVVIMTERTLGRKLPMPAYNRFKDTNTEYVLKACQYGIINGVSETEFRPDQELKRQEVAAMMIRAMELMQSELNVSLMLPAADTLPFKDVADIDPYAVPYIKYAYANNILKGNTDGTVTPQASITAEQCAALVARTYGQIQEKIASKYNDYQKLLRASENLVIGYAYGDTAATVTSSLLLPISAPGGVAVSWHSSDSSVIASNGQVFTPTQPRTVTLTASLTVGGQTMTRMFTVTTSTLSGETLINQNASETLTIGFWNPADTLDSVTSHLFLPKWSMGLPVTWSSSRTDLINTDGQVTLPNNSGAAAVTLTATVGGRTRNFTVRVQNPQYTGEITLHGIAMGMSEQQVANIMGGTTKSTLWTTNNEAWRLYYNNNYSNFIAIIFVNQRVVGVYSMASDWAKALCDTSSGTSTVIKPEEINSMSGVDITIYADAAQTPKQYAALLFETSSSITSPRAMYSDAMEELVLILINAYRTLNSNNSTEITPISALNTLARDYSYNCFTYGYPPTTPLSSRVQSAGFEYSLFMCELPQSGGVGPQDVLFDLVRYTQPRNNILSTSASVAGIGYYGNSSKAYTTVELGSLVALTNATASGSAITVNAGATSNNITINLAPNSSNREPVSIYASSNNITVLPTGGTTSLNVASGVSSVTVQVRGNTAGSTAYIVVRGSISGATFQIPVTVSSAYATSVSITGAPLAFMVEKGGSVQMSAVAATSTGYGSPAVTWSVDSLTGVSINSSTGLLSVTSSYNGTGSFKVYASAVKDASGNKITSEATVYVIQSTVQSNYNIDTSANNNLTLSAPTVAGTTGKLTGSITSGSSYLAIATSGTGLVMSGKATGTATVSVKITSTNVYNTITKTVTVKVNAAQAKPTGITLTPGTTQTLFEGEYATINASLTPQSFDVASHQITWSVTGGTAVTIVSTGLNGVSATILASNAGNAELVATVQGASGPVTKKINIDVIAAPTEATINGYDTFSVVENTSNSSNTFSVTLDKNEASTYCDYVWSSDKPQLVSISNNGKATIKAPLLPDNSNGESYTVTLKVEVYKGGALLCTGTKTITVNVTKA